MAQLSSLSSQIKTNALVAFVDLTLYSKTSQQLDDLEVAAWMNTYYEKLSALVERDGGTIVKFIGDSALIIFDELDAERGILCLLETKDKIDKWLESENRPSRMSVRIHLGSLVAGPFGPTKKKSFDIIGKTVNETAMLKERPFCLSAQAFEKLSSAEKKRFKVSTSSTYVTI